MLTQNHLIAVLIVLVLILNQIESNFCSPVNGHAEKSARDSSPVIGNRLKRNSKEDDDLVNMYYNPNKDELLAKLIQENPWAVITNVPEWQKRQKNYTPRLGRDIGEDHVAFNSKSDRWVQEPELLPGDVISLRSPFYTPRLGKRVVNSFGKYL